MLARALFLYRGRAFSSLISAATQVRGAVDQLIGAQDLGQNFPRGLT